MDNDSHISDTLNQKGNYSNAATREQETGNSYLYAFIGRNKEVQINLNEFN